MHIILNTVEAASYLGLAQGTLEHFRVRGDGPKFMKFGRSVRYRQADLDDWMESRLVSSKSEAVQ